MVATIISKLVKQKRIPFQPPFNYTCKEGQTEMCVINDCNPLTQVVRVV